MIMLADMFSSNSSGMMFWMIAGTVAVVAILSTALTSILHTRARERTRREIAAYIAEGTIDKDTALALLRDGRSEDADDA